MKYNFDLIALNLDLSRRNEAAKDSQDLPTTANVSALVMENISSETGDEYLRERDEVYDISDFDASLENSLNKGNGSSTISSEVDATNASCIPVGMVQ